MTSKISSAIRILVVEQEQDARDQIEDLLKNDGYCVDPVRHEKEAIDKILSDPPNLILMAIPLRGTVDQVLGLACRIRKQGGLTENTPIVVFAVPTISEGAEEEISENIYAIRPDNFDQLRRLIARAVCKSSRRQ